MPHRPGASGDTPGRWSVPAVKRMCCLLPALLAARAVEKVAGFVPRPVSYTHLDVYKRQLVEAA
ncbi:hypothetical protein [Arthrobacter sp. KBS0703]|uniref:hypothetical protein n=1 Tax=Arthrobacter sp. KBS0703 TaxID=1955698 RepID=UPI00163DAFC8|nr:hypothetical protein [Arthrobacter sp. KBS0703]